MKGRRYSFATITLILTVRSDNLTAIDISLRMSGTIPLLIIITIFCSHVIQLSALSAKYAMGISPEEEVKNGDHIKPIDNRMWTIEALPIDRYGTDWNDRVLYQKMALKRASLNNYRRFMNAETLCTETTSLVSLFDPRTN
ncbi:hypothetical protein Tcan_11384 [Toxocara canis]|uniref:Uncharacterized protein n=1 Tax=Toxocara canis TaxID=6265 RepID=A0A0B2VTG1_TOXCA|nr:hypothetical protein Tcan_11384 [Toxocara canis]